MPQLKNKHILLGVTGGIAAYKTPDLVRQLKKSGAEIKVILTAAGSQLVSPAALETVSGNPVNRETFAADGGRQMNHISLAEWADLLLVAPATANCLAKFSHGLADDLLSTTYLSVTKPVLLCPAMNTAMWLHPATRANLKTLKTHEVEILDPEEGELACGTTGPGRLPAPDVILDWVEYLLTEKTLAKKKILVTAGRTVEPIDPVRFLSNHSSGRMGYALARQAWLRGAKVTLITGQADITPPPVQVIETTTAQEMFAAVKKFGDYQDAIFMAAAVADFRPVSASTKKIKKEAITDIKLTKNPDILTWLGEHKAGTCICGFALETDNAEAHAREKLKKKNCDMLVMNNPREKGAAFGHDTNKVTIYYKGKKEAEALPLLDKQEVAGIILERYLESTVPEEK
jgi:phosphopantothenoylcysteine decarboxylase/phosphopantothenate--cysteine ligase